MGGTMAELKIIQSNMMALMACDALRDFYPGERATLCDQPRRIRRHPALRAGLGRAVPDNLLVLGFDNREFSAFWPIPISTFKPPLEQMGQLGMQLLLGQIQNPDRPPRGEVTKMPAALIIRKSTCRPIV